MEHPGSQSHHRAARPGQRALRFLTAGSVDDGKSTLIGRLLLRQPGHPRRPARHAAERAPAGAPIDLSLLTDGLEAEREQGITIDVAYRYFATPRRKFIIADAPGHEQYTRNMVTAAAGSDAAVVLVDITKLDTAARARCRCCRRPGAMRCWRSCCACRASSSPSTSSMRSATRRRLRGGARRAARFRSAAGIDGRRHRADLGAARRQRDAAGSRRRGTAGPSLLQVLEGLPAAQDDAHGGAAAAGAVRRPHSDDAASSGRARAGSAHLLGPHGTRQRCRRRPGAGVPERRAARRGWRCGGPGGIVGTARTPGSRSGWCSTASSTCRAATGSRAPDSLQPSRASRPRWPGSTMSRAVVGRKYWMRHGNRWVARPHRRDRKPARHPHARSPARPTSSPSTTSARSSSRRSSRCRSSATRQPRRRGADRRRSGQPTGPAAPCWSNSRTSSPESSPESSRAPR